MQGRKRRTQKPNESVIENVLLEYGFDVHENCDDSLYISNQLEELSGNVPYIYSYIIRAIYKKGIFSHWNIRFLVSQTDKYNQIAIDDAAIDIANKIYEQLRKNETKVIIGYRQGSLDMLIETFEPLVKSLAQEQYNHWPDLELEDLCQTCRMVICTLYNAGYYIHKHLIRKAFMNEIFMRKRNELRKYDKEFGKPEIVSLDDVAYNYGESVLTIADTIADEHLTDDRLMEEAEQEEHEELMKYYKDSVIDRIGQRTYDAVLKEYQNDKTSAWSRNIIYQLKKKFGGDRK